MIWLTWRQFRLQTLTALGLLAALAIGLVVLGLQMRSTYDATIVGCSALDNCSRATRAFRQDYDTPVSLLSVLFLGVPAILGSFWGAPLITRELETGTFRLVWTQSVTRTRWLAVKLAGITLAGVVVAGVFTLLLTWAADPYDTVVGGRFGALSFGARNVAPLAYAVFALVLGTTVGLVVRRTLPAMALTIAIFAAVQVAMPLVVRSHLLPPVERSVAFNATTLQRLDGFGLQGDPPSSDGTFAPGTRVIVDGYDIPGAWMLTRTMPVLDSTGDPVPPAKADPCFQRAAGREATGACLTALNLHFDVAYQPGSRYWPFQLIETAGFLLVTGLMAGFCLWRIPRGVTAA